VHDAGKLAAAAVKVHDTNRRRIFIMIVVSCAAVLATAQESSTQSPSLGELARKTRKDNSAPGHVRGKQLADEENDGPDTTGVWRVQLCTRTPCYELSVVLPPELKWTRPQEEPRPVLIPLPGAQEDASRVIRLYVAESPAPIYSPLDVAKRGFLQGWFARPEYFGRAAHIDLDEHIAVDGNSAVISHFTVLSGPRHRGLSVVATSPNGSYGFACVYREQDSSTAASICDAIVKSARAQKLEPAVPTNYPDEPPGDPEELE
jgi:hypothetical protein